MKQTYTDIPRALTQVRSFDMAKKLDDVMAALPNKRRKRVKVRATALATLKATNIGHVTPAGTNFFTELGFASKDAENYLAEKKAIIARKKALKPR